MPKDLIEGVIIKTYAKNTLFLSSSKADYIHAHKSDEVEEIYVYGTVYF